MRLIITISAAITASFLWSCKSSSGGDSAAVFCDTACFKDSIRYDGNHKLAPYVIISSNNCKADTITWSYKGMGVNRKIGIADFMKREIYLDKKYVRCYIRDTANAILMFNDCATGRGYWLKLPFNKTANIGRKSGALNNFDRKFSIPDNIAAYTDRGNLFVEDITNGKTAMMTFGKDTEMDFDAIHETIDSVNITPVRIWAKVKVDNKWVELSRDIDWK